MKQQFPGRADNDYFKNAVQYRFEVTQGTADRLWYFRTFKDMAWIGGYATKAMAVTKATARCSREMK